MVLENIDMTALGTQMGGSAILGAVIGFAAKKIAKILALLVGLELVVFKFLESRGVLAVNWDRLGNASADISQQGAEVGQTFLETFVSTAGIGASFTAGFFLGFKKA